MKLKSINPSTNEVLGEVEASSKSDIKEKVKIARKAQGQWQKMGVKARVEFLKDVIKLIDKSRNELAELVSKEMGMLLGDAIYDIEDGVKYLNWYLDNGEKYLAAEVTLENDKEIHQVYREPYGVTAVIIPWNFPFSNFVWQCGQNLVAGNAVILKHSEEVPLFSKKLEEIVNKSDLPKGVFSVVYGDGKVGDYLARQDIDLICFTGSTKVGRYLYKLATVKLIPILMELGGSAPGIIFEDAQIDKVLDIVIMNRFFNNGQVCDGLKRLIIHESRLDKIVNKIIVKLEKMKIGNASNKNSNLGPMVAERQVKILEQQVEDAVKKGARILIGGKRPANLNGAYYLPTVMTNIRREMRVWKEEVFGPVLPIVSFKTTEEAIKLANDTKYGLGAYVFTQDKKLFDRVSSLLKSGMVSHNNLSYLKACNPFGGYKQSGMGRNHGKYGFEDVTQIKLIAREK